MLDQDDPNFIKIKIDKEETDKYGHGDGGT